MTECSVFPLPGNEYFTEYRNALDQVHREGDLPAVEYSDGDKSWYKEGKLHREGGLPAIEGANGNKSWYVNGLRHREGGLPAIDWVIEHWTSYNSGYKEWYVNGLHHREGGLPAVEIGGTKQWWVNGKKHRDNGLPAVEDVDGTKAWYVNGLRHREGGLPAVERKNGTKVWWLNGKKLSENQGLIYFAFCQKMKEKKRVRAQKKIYFWWIQICYDLDHHSGCGKRMALKNLEEFETMMKV